MKNNVREKSGIIILNKEAEISSNTAVNKVKYIVGAKKAGHLGTLDVLGEGVLPITLNKATKLFDYFLKKDKVYKACFVFGIETDTLDSEGKIINIDYRLITRSEIEESLKKFQGKIIQLPPQYSALKIKGKSAYSIARKGGDVELKPREVQIFKFKLLEDLEETRKQKLIDRFLKFHNIDLLKNSDIKNSLVNNIFEFEITCSSGTYVRSLCRDLGKTLTTCSTMLSIVRTRCGAFEIKDAKNIEQIKFNDFNIIDTEKVIDLPSIFVSENEGKDILDGKKIKHLPIQKSSFKLFANNIFFGIANNKNNGIIKIETFLKE